MLGAGRLMELEATGKRARSASSGVLEVDRLSDLPDNLIHHIMSFMKARQVVQTCLLSTRWTQLWRSVSSLDLDMKEFMTTVENNDTDDNEDSDSDYSISEDSDDESSEDNDDESDDNASYREWERFEDFTDHLLVPNNIAISLLDTFQLHVTNRNNWGRQAARWIRHGMKYSAQVPGIQGKGLSCSSWRVKRLHLSNVHLDDRFTKHVSSGCQNLEYLELSGCPCTFRDITSHSLKNLILRKCSYTKLSEIKSSTLKNLVIDCITCGAFRPRLIILAPAVADLFLALNSYYTADVAYSGMPSLVNASIHLPGYMRSHLSKDLTKVLSGLCNVTSLDLLGFHTKVLGQKSTAFPNFKNLKTLLLNQCDLSYSFMTLGHFLKNSPYLETLTLRCCKFPKYLKKWKGKTKSKKVPSSEHLNLVDAECKNLKLTEIIHKDDDDVHLLVELLLSILGYPPQNNMKLTKAD